MRQCAGWFVASPSGRRTMPFGFSTRRTVRQGCRTVCVDKWGSTRRITSHCRWSSCFPAVLQERLLLLPLLLLLLPLRPGTATRLSPPPPQGQAPWRRGPCDPPSPPHPPPLVGAPSRDHMNSGAVAAEEWVDMTTTRRTTTNKTTKTQKMRTMELHVVGLAHHVRRTGFRAQARADLGPGFAVKTRTAV